MLTIDELHKKYIMHKIIPSQNIVDLKLYCQYYEEYIEQDEYVAVDETGNIITVQVLPSQIAHILDLHAFYDNKIIKPNVLRYRGSFTQIDGFANMKRGNITFENLKKSHHGDTWKNNTARYRVLCFPFIREAIMNGEWYIFDSTKFSDISRVNADYIVSYRVEDIYLNFCLSRSKESDNYFCITNLIAFECEKYINPMQSANIVSIHARNMKTGRLSKVRYHAQPLKRIFSDNKRSMVEVVTVSREVHDQLITVGAKFNSVISTIDENLYELIYWKMDSSIARKLEKVNVKIK